MSALTTSQETKTENVSPAQLYWRAPTFEALNALHAEHKLNAFNFNAILNRSIENKDLEFAIKLFISNLTPLRYDHFLCVDSPDFHSEIIRLCVEKDDLARLKYMFIYTIYDHSNFHKAKSPCGYSIVEDLVSIGEYEDARIEAVINENKSYEPYNLSVQMTACPSKNEINLFFSNTLWVTPKSKEMLEYIFKYYKLGYIKREDPYFINQFIENLIKSKNIEMLKFVKSRTYYMQKVAFAEDDDCTTLFRGNYTVDKVSEYLLRNRRKLEYLDTLILVELLDIAELTYLSFFKELAKKNIKTIKLENFKSHVEHMREWSKKESLSFGGFPKTEYETVIAKMTAAASKSNREDILDYLLKLPIE